MWVVERQDFEELVARVLGELPEEFQNSLENIDVVVQDYPTREQRASAGRGMTLLGLYEGVPHTRRTRRYGLVPPDKITIFQRPIEANCRSQRDVEAEVRKVVFHEIAHHFGLDDAQLRRIEAEKSKKERK